MFKPSKHSFLMPAVWVLAIAIAAVMMLGGASHLRSASASRVKAVATKEQASAVTPERSGQVRAKLHALPLAFEANQGQTDPQVKYMARGSGYTVFLTGNETVFAVSSSPQPPVSAKFAADRAAAARAMQYDRKTAAIHMKLVNGNVRPEITAGSELPGVTNYFIGNDSSKWQTGVKHYSNVSYRKVYPGVDMTFHGQQRQVEFDFVVAAEADAAPIRFAVTGAKRTAIDTDGNLVLSSAAGDVLLHRPVAYQEKENRRQPVEARFALNADQTIGFELGAYDRSRELVIDPSLSYATYLGGTAEDEVFGIAIDSSNNVYVTGDSDSTSGFPGGNAPTGFGFYAFVTKLSPLGTLTYTTFMGGSKSSTKTSSDTGLAITADSAGAAYVTGITESIDFYVSPGAPQHTKGDNGGNCTNNSKLQTFCSDAFAFKLDAAGSVTCPTCWSTFIGGSNEDDGFAIALDGKGNTWVAGDTFSGDFQPYLLSKAQLNPPLSFNKGVSLNPPADDGFVVEIDPLGTVFPFSTFLGGSFADQINGIAIDGSNNVYVVGETLSTDFPTTKGAYQIHCGSDGNCNASSGAVYADAFVTKVATGASGTSIAYSTYIGGSSTDLGLGIAVDSGGNAYITGQAKFDDTSTVVPYPTTSGAYSTTLKAAQGGSNAFVTELNAGGTGLLYSTFLGGSMLDIGGALVLDKFGDAYVTGMTQSGDFPVTSNTKLSGSSDAFVTVVSAGGSSLAFSTFLGGSKSENSVSQGAIALDSSGNIWVAGDTNSKDFPVTKSTAAESTYGGDPYDGFIAEYSAPAPSFGISASTPQAVSPGTSASSTVRLTSLFGYNAAVNLSCSVSGGGTPAPACSATSFSPNPVTPTSTGAASTLTITTTGASGALNRTSRNMFYAMWVPVLGLALVGMRFSSDKCGRKKLLGFLLLGIVMTMLFFLPACGGSNNNNNGGGCKGCTPAGSYTVTVTGTDSSNVSNKTTITLTVN